ncbi:MAG: hypothetical protein AB1758_37775, partial [Candidatus Eremiobacterota bacterium]
RPSALGPEEAGLFVSCGPVEVGSASLTRSYGMGQLGLPDLVLDQGSAGLMGALVPALVALEAPLAVGVRVELEGEIWKVASPPTPSEDPRLASRHGLVALLKQDAPGTTPA